MCIREITTQAGIPVRFDDKHEPLFSGLRRTLGLQVEGKEKGSVSQQEPTRQLTKVTPPLPVARTTAGFIASGRSFKMGCGTGSRKLIRGY